jgi:putative inorganic carbon (HCO3(-)) transporter
LWFIPLAISLWLTSLKPFCHAATAPPAKSDSGALVRAVAVSLALGFLLLTFALAQSRGAALALSTALIFMLACLGRKGLTAAIAAGTAAAGGAWLLGLRPVIEWIFAGGAFATRSVRNFAGRLELWSRAIYFIQDHPLTGIGMNTFRSLLQAVYPTQLIRPNVDIGHAHSQWLQAALDLGIPGLVAYQAMWVAVAVMLLGTWRRAADPWLRAITLGLGGSLAAYFVFGLADAVALGAKPGVAFWLLLALCAAAWQVANTRGRNPAQAGEPEAHGA